MKQGSQRFRAIQRLIEKKERDAASAYGSLRRQRDEARARLRDLESYHQEYLQRYRQAMVDGGDPARLREYQLFIGRLEQAIIEQQRIVADAASRCDQAKNAWSEQYTQVQAIGNVVERKQTEERREEGRQEQKLIDDRAPRRD